MSKKFIENTITTLAGLYCINTLLDIHANNLIKAQDIKGHTYTWTHGDVFYRTKGSGQPILLIHDLDCQTASYEWDDITQYLSKNHMVYSVDLPGCGLSKKPKCVYSGYMYVQFIKAFTKDVIKKPPIVIACRDSAPFIIMANHMYPKLFKNVILLNPPALINHEPQTDALHMAYMKLLFLPIVGTGAYNLKIASSVLNLKGLIDSTINKDSIFTSRNAFIASHLDNSNGKFLYASKINNFLTMNFEKQFSEADNIRILISGKMKNAEQIIHSYLKKNPNTEIIKLDTGSSFPHRDVPGKTVAAIKSII